MKRLNCFAAGFSLIPSRVVYQHGGETPSQAPTPPEGGKKEKKPTLTPEQMEARKQREAKERQRRLFEELSEKVEELQTRRRKLPQKENERDEMQNTEWQMIREEMTAVAKQFNQKFKLKLDFKNLRSIGINTFRDGISIFLEYSQSPKLREHYIDVSLLSDGTYEKEENRTYSRDGKRSRIISDNTGVVHSYETPFEWKR